MLTNGCGWNMKSQLRHFHFEMFFSHDENKFLHNNLLFGKLLKVNEYLWNICSSTLYKYTSTENWENVVKCASNVAVSRFSTWRNLRECLKFKYFFVSFINLLDHSDGSMLWHKITHLRFFFPSKIIFKSTFFDAISC